MAIPPTDIRILFTNYDIITYFLNLAFCSEYVISIKHRILATFNINNKFNSDSLYAFKLLATKSDQKGFKIMLIYCASICQLYLFHSIYIFLNKNNTDIG